MAIEILKPEWGAQRPIRGVLFDMDGLVLDSERLYVRFWMEAAQLLGHPMTFQQTLGLRSLNAAAAQAHLDRCLGPGIDYAAMRRKRIELMDAHVAKHGIPLKPGIGELLDYLDSRGIPAAITSSSPMDSIRKHLTANHLCHRFSQLCSGHDVPNGKPAPDIYLHGAAALGLKPEECLALEDSPAGILAAYRAGCLSVMVPDLDQPGEATKALLYAKADSLADIIDLLQAEQ